MKQTVSLEALQSDLTFKSDLMIDETFILLPATVPVTEELTNALVEWDFKKFIYEGNSSAASEQTQTTEVDESSFNIENNTSEKIANDISSSVKKVMEKQEEEEENSEQQRMQNVEAVYNKYMAYINSVYTYYATHKKIKLDEISETVKELCVFIRENKRYVLRISPSAEARSKNFLVIHSMRSTVLSITIGLELHLALSKLIELGVTSILHEIGMLRLPPQLYMTDKKLSSGERAQISTHTILGYKIMKELNFPLSVQLGVLEHHEKENGTGYPQRLIGNRISTYAKIISVACSFEAITAPREYKTERTAFDAMVEMLKNDKQQYDATVIKGLLYSLSLYPIGAYVFLKNGKIGLVVDVNPNNPINPIIQLINEKEKDGSPKIVQTDDDTNKIARVLSKEEEKDVIASLKKQNQIENTSAAFEESENNRNRTENFSFVDLSDFA